MPENTLYFEDEELGNVTVKVSGGDAQIVAEHIEEMLSQKLDVNPLHETGWTTDDLFER